MADLYRVDESIDVFCELAGECCICISGVPIATGGAHVDVLFDLIE